MNGLNKKGDITNEWIKFQHKWKKEHPPYDNGCYLCGICGRWVLSDEVELDHITPRSNSPHLVFSEENIQPSHSICNRRKGSSHIKPVVSKDVYEFLDWMQTL